MNVFRLTYHKDVMDKNEIRVDGQRKQFHYYNGGKHNLEYYLNKALALTYTDTDIKKFQFQFVNLTKKLINQLAVVYRTPPQRYLISKDRKITVSEVDGRQVEINSKEKEEKEWTEYYNNLLSEDINKQDMQGHRLAKLHNTIITQVLFDEHKGRIKYKTKSSYLYDVEPDQEDEKRIAKVMYPKYFKVNNEDVEYTVVWDGDDKLYAYDAYGNPVKLPTKTDKKNPYGINPFATLRIEDQDEDFWGDGKDDVINVNEQVNLLLTKLINRDIILGTEGTLLAVNCNLNKRADEDRIVRASVSNPVVVDKVHTDDAQPSLQHVSFNPQIDAIKSTIDWYIGYIAGLNGIKAENLLAQVKDTSDYQKIMDSVDQMELRKDDIEPCRSWEKEKFEITRKVNNTYAGTEIGDKFGIKIIPDEFELKIDFAEIEVHKTPADLQAQREWEAKYGLSTPYEWLMQDNPDLSEVEAKKIIEDNKNYLRSIQGTQSRLMDLLNKQQPNQ